MFPTFKNMDTAYRQQRVVALAAIVASAAVSLFSIGYGYRIAQRAEGHIYVMENGKAAEAVAIDRKEDLPVEARCHIRNFHVLFFTLDPDMKAILANVGQAFYLADGSAKRLFDNLREAGFYAGIVAGNISQSIRVDSVSVDIRQYPYRFKCYATEKIIRATTITTRVLVTTGRLRNSARSDNNGFGFLIEGLEVLDNRDVLVQNREL